MGARVDEEAEGLSRGARAYRVKNGVSVGDMARKGVGGCAAPAALHHLAHLSFSRIGPPGAFLKQPPHRMPPRAVTGRR